MSSQEWLKDQRRMDRLAGPRELSSAELTRLRRWLSGGRRRRLSLSRGRPWVDVPRLNRLVGRLGTNQRLEPYELVCELARCSDELAMLLAASSEVGGTRIFDHTQDVLSGFEDDYSWLFATAVARTIERLFGLCHDLGRGLAFALTGETVEQQFYNLLVVKMLLEVINPEVLSADGCRAVELTVGQDIAGEAARGRFDHRTLDGLRGAWPPTLAGERDTILLVAYLMDATAHTGERRHRDATWHELVPAKGPGERTLSWLFERDPRGALTLRDPVRLEMLRRLFPNLGVAGSLLAGPATPPGTTGLPRRVWKRARSTPLAWYAVLGVRPLMPFVAVRAALSMFVRRQLRRGQEIPSLWLIEGRMTMPRRVWCLCAPTNPRLSPSSGDCERHVLRLADETGWRLVPTGEPEPGIMAVLVLPEGDKPELHTPLAGLLRHGTDWCTLIVHLATVSIDAATDQAVWRERLAVLIRADDSSLLEHVKAVAETLGLDRFPVVDFRLAETYELRLAGQQ